MNKRLQEWFFDLVGTANPDTTQNLYRLFQVAMICIIAVLLFAAFLMLSRCTFPPGNLASCGYGEVGDFVGGLLNPILTFLAFMGLLITIAVQKDELQQTRDQLESAAKSQIEIAELQKQELKNNTLFKLISALRDSATNPTIKTSNNGNLSVRSGLDALTDLLNMFCLDYYDEIKNMSQTDAFNKSLKNRYELQHTKLSSYFEQLKFILRWIDENSEQKKIDYRLLAANMSYQEIMLVYIHRSSPLQTELKFIVDKVNLIQYLPEQSNELDKFFRSN